MGTKSFSLKLNYKIKPFKKNIKIDSDKSISIRSFLIGSISQNITSVTNALESEDVFSTIDCLKKLGVRIKKKNSKNYLVYGKGLGSLYAKRNTKLSFGNSGTLARLLLGILSTTPGIELNVSGDHSLNKRSMQKLIKLLSEFGATFFPKNRNNFPLKIISSSMPIGFNYNAEVSAQLKSAVIFGGLNSYGETNIFEKYKSRDHTENMLIKNTKAIKIFNKRKKIIRVFGKNQLKPMKINVPGDPSSAAFFTALTLLNEKSYLKIKNVCLNKTRTGFYQILKKQGARIKIINLKKNFNEPKGDIIVRSSKLKPIKVDKSFYVNSTDEYPILFVMASLIKGTSSFSGIGDLANKESNRIIEMQKVLKQLGIKSKFKKNVLKIYGKGLIDANNKKILVPKLGDHRICMSAFVLSILTGAKSKIKNFDTVFTSSPSFLKIMKTLGAKFEKKN